MNQVSSIISDAKPNVQLSELAAFCKSSRLVLYGAGLTGKTVLEKLRKHSITPLFIADDTPAKQGTVLDDVRIIPLSELTRLEEPFALIVTMLNPQMNFYALKEALHTKGIQHVYSFIELSFLYPDDLLPYFHFDLPEELLRDTAAIQDALDLFLEPQSKAIFSKNLAFRLNLDFAVIPAGDKNPYFPSSIISIPDGAMYIDCGAFDGDTVDSFVKRSRNFHAAYAFEPDPNNFNKLLTYCASLPEEINKKVYAFNYGLSSGHSFLKFNSLNNMASAIDQEGNVVIQTTDLDSLFMPLLCDFLGSIFIKMDIEGAEPQALIGIRQLMETKQPHLAISIYHNPDDLWRIPLYIHSVNPNYQFLLRQHGNDSMDLVLYALAK